MQTHISKNSQIQKKILVLRKNLRSHKNSQKTMQIPKKKRQKFGRFCIGNRVGFVGWMVGWLDGWMVGRLDGKEIFEYTPDRNGPKTRATRRQASLRSEKNIFLF